MDLVDLYFDQEEWKKILKLAPIEDLWPARFAAYVHSGRIFQSSDREVFELLKPLIGNLGPSTELTVLGIWEATSNLNQDQRFYLATACCMLDPSLKEAVRVAVIGYQNRGKIHRAIELAEKFIQQHPSDPDPFRWLAKCYEMQGAREAAALCHEQANKLAESSSFEVPGVLEKAL